MNNTERAAMQQRLNDARDDAVAALDAATDALQTAQLQAVALNIPIPGKLTDDVEAARRRLSNCEGALVAFARQGDDEAALAWRNARAEREALVSERVDQFRSDAHALVAAVEKLVTSGAGAAVARALDAVRQGASGAGISVLTDAGWQTSDSLRALLTKRSDDIAMSIVQQVLQGGAHGAAAATEYADAFADGIVGHIKAQPDNWPAA